MLDSNEVTDDILTVVDKDNELTLARAEAIFLVFVIVSSGGAPWQTISTAFSDAGGVRLSLKAEREVAHGTLCIAIASLNS